MINLKNVREAQHMSVDELAGKTDIAKQTIWAYERGDRNPDPATLCLLADTLDCSLDMLVRGKEKDRPFGRSLEENLKLFRELSDEQIDYFTQVMQAVKADRRFQAHLRQDASEVQ